MKLPSVIPPVFRGKAGEPPGIVAVARVDRKTKSISKRLNTGEIAVIDHSDLDRVSAEELIRRKVSAVVNASMSITGRYPNLGPQLLLDAGIPVIDGVGHPMVMTYSDVLTGARVPGRRVAIIGAGGIGFDVAEFLLGDAAESLEPDAFLRAWNVDPALVTSGGLAGPPRADVPRPDREVTLLQRTAGRPGVRLGKSTGWILKARLRQAGVRMVSGVSYTRITGAGLHYELDGHPALLEVDSVVLCTGQESERSLYDELAARGIGARLIGGADLAAELDAVRAIDQATRLAVTI